VAVFFAVTLSIDALGVGVSCGLRGMRPAALTHIVVFCVSLCVMAVSVFFGSMITSVLTPRLAEIIAAAWICLLGLWIALGALKSKGKGQLDETAKQKPGAMMVRAFSLAFMLSIDSMGAGLAAAALGVTIAFLPIYVAFFQTAFLFIGMKFVPLLPIAKKGGKLPTVVSGVLLMVIGMIGLMHGNQN